MKLLIRTYTFILSLLFTFSVNVFGQHQAVGTTATSITTTTTGNNSTHNWTSTLNAQTQNNLFATCLIDRPNRTTQNLDAKSWGFQSTNAAQPLYIPSNAVINGIEVSVLLKKTNRGTLRDNKIMLLKNGNEVGANYAKTTTWPSVTTKMRYGGISDLWGTTWSVNDILNSNFGVRLSAKNKGGRDVQAEIDHITITVYFNEKFFYSKSTGSLDALSTWGSNTDGSGIAPLNFTNTGQIFTLTNRATVTLTNNFSVTGSNAKFVVGNGTTATTLTIPANYTLNANVDVNNNSQLIITNPVGPNVNNVGNNTTVTYNAATNQNIDDVAFYNLTIGGSGNKYIATNQLSLTLIENTLSIQPNATLVNEKNNVIIFGAHSGIVNNGTISGSGRFIYSIQDINSSITGSGRYSNLEIDASSTTTSIQTISLANLITITGELLLTDGILSSTANLKMETGSVIRIKDGLVNGNLTTSNDYDVEYLQLDGTTRTTGNELTGKVRNIKIQPGVGKSIKLHTHLSVTGNIEIADGELDPTTANYNLTLGGNFINNATVTARNNTITFNGNKPQYISGSEAQTFHRLSIANEAGGSVQLSVPVSVNDSLLLNKGILTTSTTNTLTLGSLATIAGGNKQSFVNGSLRHTVAALSTTKFFPVGKGSTYQPVSLSINQKTTQSSIFTAEAFIGSAPARTVPSDIQNISTKRYLTINTSNLSNFSSARITINYTEEDGITDAANLRIAKSNGPTQWMNIGGQGTAAGTGSITSDAFYGFSDFALASARMSTLPLKWGAFIAVNNTTGALLKWETTDEVNTDFFEVQKSNDGSTWQSIGTLNSKNKSFNAYTFTDVQAFSISYYRIKQVDNNGKFTYSKVVQLTSRSNSRTGITVMPTIITNNTFTCVLENEDLFTEKDVVITITSASGSVVFSKRVTAAKTLQVYADVKVNGVYFVAVSNSRVKNQSTIMIQ